MASRRQSNWSARRAGMLQPGRAGVDHHPLRDRSEPHVDPHRPAVPVEVDGGGGRAGPSGTLKGSVDHGLDNRSRPGRGVRRGTQGTCHFLPQSAASRSQERLCGPAAPPLRGRRAPTVNATKRRPALRSGAASCSPGSEISGSSRPGALDAAASTRRNNRIRQVAAKRAGIPPDPSHSGSARRRLHGKPSAAPPARGRHLNQNCATSPRARSATCCSGMCATNM